MPIIQLGALPTSPVVVVTFRTSAPLGTAVKSSAVDPVGTIRLRCRASSMFCALFERGIQRSHRRSQSCRPTRHRSKSSTNGSRQSERETLHTSISSWLFAVTVAFVVHVSRSKAVRRPPRNTVLVRTTLAPAAAPSDFSRQAPNERRAKQGKISIDSCRQLGVPQRSCPRCRPRCRKPRSYRSSPRWPPRLTI